MARSPRFQEHFSPADILSLVRDHLPVWMRACEATDTDAIALHEAEFGTTTTELLLFACAIKFAARKGKNVYVTCEEEAASPDIMHSDQFIAVYREATHPNPAVTRALNKSKRPAGRRNRSDQNTQ